MSDIIYDLGLDKETIWDNDKIGRFDAFFPKQDLQNTDVTDIPKFVKINIATKTHVLKTTQKDSRIGNVYVSPSTYDGQMIRKINISQASEFSFLTYRIRNDKNQQIATSGLFIATVGLVIDGSFAIGKAGFVRWILSNNQILFWMITAIILKVLGLGLVYIKGLKEAK
jgi:hypothetical protein